MAWQNKGTVVNTAGVQGYLALPQTTGRHPALIILHEWWGLNDWVKEQADKVAQAGYVCLASDLYRGKVAKDAEEAHELMRALPEDRALRDMKAAFNYLSKHARVRADRIGAMGWCMGGGMALNLAVNEPKLKACVIYYGRLVTDEAALKKINASVLGLFGDQDRGIPVSDVEAFRDTLKRLKKQVEIHIYKGAGHAFANQNNARGYHPASAADSWQKTRDFLKRTLG